MWESVKIKRVKLEKVLVSWSKLKDGRGRETFTTPRYLAIIFLYDIIIGETIEGLLLYNNLWVLLLYQKLKSLVVQVGETWFFFSKVVK